MKRIYFSVIVILVALLSGWEQSVVAQTPCSGTPTSGIANASVSSGCQSLTTNLSDVGGSTASGITYQWMQSPISGSGYFNCAGASASPAYTATVTTPGVTYYVCKVTCANGGGNALTNILADTLNPNPTPITPMPANLCTGIPSAFVSAPAGGTWTSANTAVATTMGSVSGNVTGVSVGVTTITYTLPTGCIATTTVTVNPQPPAITGPSAVCQSQSTTTTYTDTSTGGTWTSSTPGVATIGASSGVLTAIAPGTTYLTYASVLGCYTSATITVNSLPTLFIVNPSSYSYCAGSPSTGHVTLSGSIAGVTYQLLLGGSSTGLPSRAGTGAGLDFGVQTAAGIYTVLATNNITGCSRLMVNSVHLAINPIPSLEIVSVFGSPSYCADSPSTADIRLSSSSAGISYQLQLAGLGISTLPGGGGPLDFGVHSTAGLYNVLATDIATGCQALMADSVTVTVNPLPASITGAVSVCNGLSTSLNDTTPSGTWSSGSTSIATIGSTGTVSGLSAGMAGITYTLGTGCIASTVVTVNPLPPAHNVLPPGSSSYCDGGAGIDVQLDGSDTGISYTLLNDITAVSTLTGTGSLLEFGMQTVAGAYTISAVNLTTGCTTAMTGTATISINPLPPAHTVSVAGGGSVGSYCAGGSGVDIVMDNSDGGVNYQLYNGVVATGLPVSGTGLPLDFGFQAAAGTYTVQAASVATSCPDNMPGSVTVSINPLPAAFNVLPPGSSSYCDGGAGIDVQLDGSDTGISYTLLNGITAISTLTGTGSLRDFGMQTVAGAYTISAANLTTGCTTAMTGTATISINPLPPAHTVSVAGGGSVGSYCAGGAGVDIVIDNSDGGINYQLYQGLVAVGMPVAGGGLPLDFGYVTAAGAYTAIAINTTTLCQNNMLGAPSVSINPLPGAISGPSAVCEAAAITLADTGSGTWASGTPGVASVGSSSGIISGVTAGITTITYTLPTGCITAIVITVNPAPTAITGNVNVCLGSTYSFADGILGGAWSSSNTSAAPVGSSSGMVTGAGLGTSSIVYTLPAGCFATTSVTVDPLPSAITGTTDVCAGLTETLHNSTAGGSWSSSSSSLATIGAATGAVTGISAGSPLITYTLPTGCSSSTSFTVMPLPVVHTVSGGGYYCSGGAGLHIGLFGSDTGISYQLYKDASIVGSPLAGTGAALDFGLQIATGDYTVSALNSATTCTDMMGGSQPITTVSLPVAYNVTGGGGYCAEGAGVNVGLNNSNSNIRYQLMEGTTTIGSPLTGTGTALDFGVFNTGTYKVVARNPISTCMADMNDSAVIFIDTLFTPAVAISVKPTGKLMAGGSDTLHAAVTGGSGVITYQWINNFTYISGATTATYINNNFNDLDSVSCLVYDSTMCGNILTHASVTLRMHDVSVQPVTIQGSNLTLVPNPNKGTFTIRGTLTAGDNETVSLEVTDMLGQVVYQQTVQAPNGELNEQVLLNNSLANGMYLLNIRSGTENGVFHFVLGK